MSRATVLISLLVAWLSVVAGVSAETNSCMGVPSFNQWADGRPNPYRAESARAKTIKNNYGQVKLGMRLEQIRSIMPAPDFSEDSWQGCTWYFALLVGSDNVTSQTLGVRFNSDGVVNGLSKDGIFTSTATAHDKHPIPKTVDEAVQILKTKWLSPKDLEWVLRNPQKEVVYTLYLPFGTGVRNEFGLWGDNQALRDSCGDNNPEGCSVVIFSRLWESVRAAADPKLVKQIDCQVKLAESIHINPRGFRKLNLGKLFAAIQSQTNDQIANIAASGVQECQSSITIETSGRPDLECFADVNLEDKQKDVTLEHLLRRMGFGTFFSVSHYPPKIVLDFSRSCQFKTPPYLYGKSW